VEGEKEGGKEGGFDRGLKGGGGKRETGEIL
jgi:hypothetical protein